MLSGGIVQPINDVSIYIVHSWRRNDFFSSKTYIIQLCLTDMKRCLGNGVNGGLHLDEVDWPFSSPGFFLGLSKDVGCHGAVVVKVLKIDVTFAGEGWEEEICGWAAEFTGPVIGSEVGEESD